MAILRPLASLAAFVALTGATVAHAQTDTRVSVTDTAIVEYHADNRDGDPDEDNYTTLINRLNLTGNAGDIEASVRVDGFVFIDAPTNEFRDRLSLERISVGWSRNDWEVEAGDFYEQLGRGILLSVRKIDEAGVDIAIRGGTVSYRGDDHRARVFAGRSNPANIDTVNQHAVPDADDVIIGGAYELRALDPVDISVFGVYVEPNTSFYDTASSIVQDSLCCEARQDRHLGTGIAFDMPSLTNWLSLYFEGDTQEHLERGEVSRGWGGYGTADLQFGDTGILFEGIYLDEMYMDGSPNPATGNAFSYVQPPTLERIDQEVFNVRSFYGGRARVSQYIYSADLNLYASGMYRIQDPDADNEVTQVHVFGGMELYYDVGASRVNVSAGWRDEDITGAGDSRDFKDMIHFEGDWVQSVGTGWAFHLTTDNQLRTLEGDDYARGSTFVGVERNGLGALTFEYGYDTQNQADGVANHFYAGILRAEAGEHVIVQAVGGTQRGGIKCVNGVCREYPGFAGGRVEVISRF